MNKELPVRWGSQVGWATGLSLPTILKKVGKSTLAYTTPRRANGGE